MEQGKVLAAAITGEHGPVFAGATPAAKLKIMGVEIFSAGSIDESEAGVELVRYEDPSLGIYKKLLVKDNRLRGVILVGDTADERRYTQWLREGMDLAPHRRHLLFPPPAADAGLEVAAMPDSEVICGCNGVNKGTIIHAIHEHGINTLDELKQRTRASTSCGSCTDLCQQLLRASHQFQEETRTTLCACVPFSYEQLREIVRGQQLKSVQEVLNIYGNRKGCEVCKPALSYMLDMIWCGGHDEDRSARFINDRVHANIQKDGTFSVVPRMRGGVTTPDELRRIADVAEKYKVPHGQSHRKPASRSAGSEEGRFAAGLGRSRNAIRSGVHQGRPHGEDLRRDRILQVRRARFHWCRELNWSGGWKISLRRTK